MKITGVRAIPVSDPIPEERRHRTDLGTKIKSDSVIIQVETDEGLVGLGASLGSPHAICAIVEYELAPALVGEDPIYSEFLYEKMYNGSRWKPSLERGFSQPREDRRGLTMEAIAGVDIAVWDVKSQAMGLPVYKVMGAVRDSVRGYASGGWAPGDEAEQEMAGYAAKGFTAVKMRVVGRDGFSIENTVRRVKAARRGIGPDVELMIDAHGSLDISTAIRLARKLEQYDIAWFEEPISPDNHPGLAEVRRSGHRPARRRPRRRSHGDPSHRRSGIHEGHQAGAPRLGLGHPVRRQHTHGNGRTQLPHPGGQPGLHAHDVRPVQRTLRHPRGHGVRAAAARPGLHAA